MDKRGLLPPEAHAFCEARYQGGEYARPGSWRDEPLRYRDYVPRPIAPPNKKRGVTAFEYLWLEQNHFELVKYHQPSLPLPLDDAESLRNQREKVERIEDGWNPAPEKRSQYPLAGVPARFFLAAGGLFAAFLRWDDPDPIRNGAIALGVLAGAISYGILWSLHAGFLSFARHRRAVASARCEVEQEGQQVLEKFLDEMHQVVNPLLQPYRR